ncbi:MFS transporter [Streptomyces yaanensis]|uniref:MFS transporter n=1 Tax=Streptomyces yaanensis TaxID=1142239 RepID=A0ABV7SNI2_9ACTN|nr:MFS transporter [Streptomyces sp. CGMCC 4.7035]WNC01743.1 MFS transporter [Streptomyces sp. CGMCC 4.7035]
MPTGTGVPIRAAIRAGRREWVGLAVLALPTMLIGLDMTVLHMAAPSLSERLHPSTTELLWIVDIYGFMVAGFLATMGTLGDRIGRRRLLLTGAAAFAAASLLAACSSDVRTLIASRALLGVAGATLMPSTLSLISNMFRDPGQRRLAVAVWMTNFSIGGMIGPLIGGLFLEHFWYGSVFLLGVPVGVVLLIAGPLLLPEYRDPKAGRLDPVSVTLSIVTVLPVVYGFKEIAQQGVRTLPLLSIAAGLCLGTVFVRRQLKLTDPMLDLRLFFRPAFGVSLGGLTLGLFAVTGTQFLLLQYFQVVLGLSPLATGLWTLPAVAAGVVGALLAPLLANRTRPLGVMAGGFLLSVPGLVLLTQAGTTSGPLLAVTAFAVLSFGVQAALALTNDVIISSAPPERAGNASGIGETGANLGEALGVAVAGSVAGAVYRAKMDGGSLAQTAFTDGMHVAALLNIGVLLTLTAAHLALLHRETARRGSRTAASSIPRYERTPSRRPSR